MFYTRPWYNQLANFVMYLKIVDWPNSCNSKTTWAYTKELLRYTSLTFSWNYFDSWVLGGF